MTTERTGVWLGLLHMSESEKKLNAQSRQFIKSQLSDSCPSHFSLYTFKKDTVLLQQSIYTVFTFLIFIAT